DSEKKHAARILSLAADSYKDEIQRWLLQCEGEARITAANPLMREGLTRVRLGGPGAERYREICTDYLQKMLLTFPQFDEIYFMDVQGRILVSTNARRVGEGRPQDDLLKRPLERGGVYFQDAYVSYATGEPSVAFATAVEGLGPGVERLPDGRVGVLVFRVKTEEILNSISRGRAWLGNTGEVILLRHDRMIINELRRRPGASLFIRSSSEIAREAVQGKEGLLETTNYAGVPVMAAYRYIPYAGWGMVAEQDLAEIMAPVRKNAIFLILTAVATILLSVLTITVVVRRALLPLGEVVRASAALAAGQLDQRVEVADAKDEISLVARAFNEMAEGLEVQFRVQDRLQQLLQVVITYIRLEPLSAAVLETLARVHDFQVGAIYVARTERGIFELLAGFCPSGKLAG
ncbi:MAG: HAMP domain-containing protein, partial [Desulfofundulus sp.]